jgi:hypothetical protein
VAYRHHVTNIPWACSSGALVARVDDVDVYLLTVDFWGDRVVVRLVAVCTEAIRAEIAGQESELEAWSQRHQSGSDEWPPRGPGERIAECLRVRVDDDAETEYELSVMRAGGSGSELLCEWVFKTAPPPAVSAVRVTVVGPDGSEHTEVVRTGADGPARGQGS